MTSIESGAPASASTRRSELLVAVPTTTAEVETNEYAAPETRSEPTRLVLALLTDAYGGRGGIARYNRDVLDALCAMDGVARVVALPRLAPDPIGALPPSLHFDVSGLGGQVRYVLAVLRQIANLRRVDSVFCGHINLVPLAWLASKLLRAPLTLMIYGIDAWQPPRSWLARSLAARANRVAAISKVTRDRFLNWCAVPPAQVSVLPGRISVEDYGLGAPDAALRQRLGLEGRVVLLTLGRMSDGERYKGFDEVIELMPRLVALYPNLTYVAAGDGSDRARLQDKAERLGVGEHVVFPGYIADDDKTDLFRLADAYVMPSTGEGFGFVVLEALASGTPVVASTLDGTHEAVLNGRLGILVDPRQPDDIFRGILAALDTPRKIANELRYFDTPSFRARLQQALPFAR
jgi:phosphatidylinositol alpha-1,6-mannosyltransferase